MGIILITTLIILSIQIPTISSQSSLCRTSCGGVPINYPLGVDDGCGSPYYRNMLACSPDSTELRLRTPSGSYPVRTISYTDPHIVVSDPSMWSCHANGPTTHAGAAPPPFSLDTSTRFSLSSKNDYLFFNCSSDSVIIQPKQSFCERFPDRCESSCDSAGYLCRNLPECPDALLATRTSCCTYYPKASESLRLMLRHCASYASVYWRTVGSSFPPYDQVPEYGIRVDFEIPVTTRCLQCRDMQKGGGTCGFEPATRGFLCLCQDGNVTTYCADANLLRHRTSAGVIAGTTTVASITGLASIGALVWYLKKMRTNKVVTCGVETTENRIF